MESTLVSAAVNGAYVFTFPRRELLDLESVQLVREKIKDLVKAKSRLRIVLDLGHVMLLTSDGIALIVSLRNAIRPYGGEIHVANISPETRTVFDHLRLGRLIRIFDTTDDAVAAFA
jgi:anti-anti-sigma factor